MDDIITTPIVVLRSTGTGPVVQGVIQDAPVVKLQTLASVQPMKGSEVLILPEGDRVKKTYKLYTYDELRIDNDVTKEKADVVQFNGENFKVIKSEMWFDDDVKYFKSLMQRENA